MNWQRIYPKDMGGDATTIKRCYSINGKTYPRVVIGIYVDFALHPKNTFHISCNRKENKDKWWENSGIPNELKPEVIEMLTEIEERSL